MMSNGRSVEERDHPLRVEHVLHSLAPPGGGTSVAVPALCGALGRRGLDVTLHVTNAGRAERFVPESFQLRTYDCLPGTGAGRFGVAPSMHTALAKAAKSAQVVHSHGLWLFANLDVYWATRGSPTQLMLSPHGMLEPYGLQRRGQLKRAVWRLGQGAAARAAHCIHVTAESELQSVRDAGLENPVAVIPNGVAIPVIEKTPSTTSRRRLLFLGRIDHKKGLDFLLHAWSRVSAEFPHWELRIVGPSLDSYAREVHALAQMLRVSRVTFAPAALGGARDRELAESDLFVLPTRSENFALTVAEALAAGVPVLCSKGAPWAGLESQRCGRWVDVGVEPLAAGLRDMMSIADDDRAGMGRRGRAWMERDFGWPGQAAAMAAVYHWLTTAGEPPAAIRFA